MENLDVAIELAAMGLYVFPCVGAGKEEDLKRPCPGIGWRGVSTTDPRTLKLFWHRFPTAVPGVDMGKSGLITIDCDRKHGPDGCDWIASLGIDVEHTPGSITPSGGRHLIYRNPSEFTNGRGTLPGKDVADIDIRGKGGYIIGPGARFVDGRGYEPVGDLGSIEELPAVLAEYLVTRPAPVPTVSVTGNGHDHTPFIDFTVHPESDARRWGMAALGGILDEIRAMPPGNRQDPIAAQAWKAGQLVWHGCLSESEVIGAIEGVVQGWSDLKKGYLGERGTVRRQVREGMGSPRRPMQTVPSVQIRLATVDGKVSEVSEVKTPFATPYVWTEPATIPRRDWLYGTLLVRKFVSMTVAPGGVGKSSLLTTEAMSQVSGRDLLGIYPPKRMKVWLWNLEDPYEEITRKVQATAKYYGLHRDDIEGRLFVNSGRDREKGLIIAKTEGNRTTLVPELLNQLVAEIERLAIDILVIDPFVSCNEVSENDNSGQDKVIKAWARVAEAASCAVHLVDHSRKQNGTEVTAGSNRGASAKVDGCRVVRVINPMSDIEAREAGIKLKDQRRYFRTINDKANLSPPAERADWYRLESVNLENGRGSVTIDLGDGPVVIPDGDSVGIVTKWTYQKEAADAGVDWPVVEQVLAEGEWRESPKSPEWIGVPIAKVMELDLSSKNDDAKVKAIIKLWVKNGRLEEYHGSDKNRVERKFIRVKTTCIGASVGTDAH